jgi:hypothetical protein
LRRPQPEQIARPFLRACTHPFQACIASIATVAGHEVEIVDNVLRDLRLT